MKTISMRVARGLVAGAFAASSALAMVSVAHAQTPAPGTPNPDMRAKQAMSPGMQDMHERHEMRGMHHMHMMRELARLKTSLRLTPEQAALWDRAEQQMKPPADLREQMKARHDRIAAMLDDPNFDPRRLAAEMDSVHADRIAKQKSLRDAWFAVYDKLNPVQRGQVREFLRSHMMHGGGMHQRMGWMHHSDAGQNKAPAPSAPR